MVCKQFERAGLRCIAVALTLALVLPCAVRAQSSTYLSGVVLDPRERPVPAAVVTLPGGNVRARRTTDASGRFTFGSLEVGSYRLAASAPGGSGSLTVDLGSDGATVTAHLFKVLASVQSSTFPVSGSPARMCRSMP